MPSGPGDRRTTVVERRVAMMLFGVAALGVAGLFLVRWGPSGWPAVIGVAMGALVVAAAVLSLPRRIPAPSPAVSTGPVPGETPSSPETPAAPPPATARTTPSSPPPVGVPRWADPLLLPRSPGPLRPSTDRHADGTPRPVSSTSRSGAVHGPSAIPDPERYDRPPPGGTDRYALETAPAMDASEIFEELDRIENELKNFVPIEPEDRAESTPPTPPTVT